MNECTDCPLKAELEQMKKEMEAKFEEQCLFLAKELAGERRRIASLETTLPKLKQSLSQVAVSKVEGSWGIAGQRADLIYSRLLTMGKGNGNGNGKLPYLSTGDVKKILGVNNYSQVYTAMNMCVEKHLDVKIIERGPRRTGITREEVKG